MYATHLTGEAYFSLELVYVENIINHSHHKAIKYLIVHGAEFATETENFVGLPLTLLGLGIQELSRRLKNGKKKNPRHEQMKYGCNDWLRGGEGGGREREDSGKRKR